MWGQVQFQTAVSRRLRIIPTRVGTRRLSTYRESRCQDHPHACGDKLAQKTPILIKAESSPRVWGQACLPLFSAEVTRIIPTRVGTRILFHIFFPFIWDHPHACGDKFTTDSDKHSGDGSSPRVWGQEKTGRLCNWRIRIIPTRVGTSKSKAGGTAE